MIDLPHRIKEIADILHILSDENPHDELLNDALIMVSKIDWEMNLKAKHDFLC